MNKKLFPTLILPMFLMFRTILPVLAVDNTQNINKFGIHIINTSDLTKAAELVNSSGGDWGWVTMVIQENDRDADKWQAFFDQCREQHLIPLIRIATYAQGAVWAKPKIDQVDVWYSFLNSLNWPTSDRYIIVYNETNHDKEWGGDSDPVEYAQILDKYLKVFSQNPKYKILNAGMDLAAPNGSTTIEAFKYLRDMDRAIPRIFNRLSAWSSHSYPNHGYLGKPTEYKKTSIRGYQFELALLKKELGVTINLPVFITETGWPFEYANCKQQINKYRKWITVCSNKYYSPEKSAEYIKYAYENYWLKDDQVVAVTPFVLNYPYTPFTEFSWLNEEGSPSAQFNTIAQIQKVDWQPKQDNMFEIKIKMPPTFLPANKHYQGSVLVKNTGESILFENGEPYFIKATSSAELELSVIIINKKLKPGESANFDFTIQTSSASGDFTYGWDKTTEKIKVYPQSLINVIHYSLWQNILHTLSNLLH